MLVPNSGVAKNKKQKENAQPIYGFFWNHVIANMFHDVSWDHGTFDYSRLRLAKVMWRLLFDWTFQSGEDESHLGGNGGVCRIVSYHELCCANNDCAQCFFCSCLLTTHSLVVAGSKPGQFGWVELSWISNSLPTGCFLRDYKTAPGVMELT